MIDTVGYGAGAMLVRFLVGEDLRRIFFHTLQSIQKTKKNGSSIIFYRPVIMLMHFANLDHLRAIKLLAFEDCETGRAPLLPRVGCQYIGPGTSYVLVNCDRNTVQEFADSECKVLRGQYTLGQCSSTGNSEF